MVVASSLGNRAGRHRQDETTRDRGHIEFSFGLDRGVIIFVVEFLCIS